MNQKIPKDFFLPIRSLVSSDLAAEKKLEKDHTYVPNMYYLISNVQTSSYTRVLLMRY